MTLQEKIAAHIGKLPESMQQEVWAFIQSIESCGWQPKKGIDSLSESSPSHPSISALDLALAHGVVGCVKDAPADLSTNKDHMQGYGE
uniref:DUF2281 domain-containing protein n=1 Tax=Candidatus Kentrum sp. SD TaxID=2126332 RepID=A0A451BJ08_9GAMM|nr:MAG: hypothetical protein BECKSD772D_GA0070982_10112 [Candidatus Kentron sp. SD]